MSKVSYREMLNHRPLTSFFEPDGRVVSLKSRREFVRELLSDGEWHSTSKINSSEVGGSEGTHRLRELREEGLLIEKMKEGDGDEYLYRLVVDGDSKV